MFACLVKIKGFFYTENVNFALVASQSCTQSAYATMFQVMAVWDRYVTPQLVS